MIRLVGNSKLKWYSYKRQSMKLLLIIHAMKLFINWFELFTTFSLIRSVNKFSRNLSVLNALFFKEKIHILYKYFMLMLNLPDKARLALILLSDPLGSYILSYSGDILWIMDLFENFFLFPIRRVWVIKIQTHIFRCVYMGNFIMFVCR